MDDKELSIKTGKCWACNAGLTSLNRTADPHQGFVACECPTPKRSLKTPIKKSSIKEGIDAIIDRIAIALPEVRNEEVRCFTELIGLREELILEREARSRDSSNAPGKGEGE